MHHAMMGPSQHSLPRYSGMRAVGRGPPCSTKLSHVPNQAKLVKFDARPLCSCQTMAASQAGFLFYHVCVGPQSQCANAVYGNACNMDTFT